MSTCLSRTFCLFDSYCCFLHGDSVTNAAVLESAGAAFSLEACVHVRVHVCMRTWVCLHVTNAVRAAQQRAGDTATAALPSPVIQIMKSRNKWDDDSLILLQSYYSTDTWWFVSVLQEMWKTNVQVKIRLTCWSINLLLRGNSTAEDRKSSWITISSQVRSQLLSVYSTENQ